MARRTKKSSSLHGTSPSSRKAGRGLSVVEVPRPTQVGALNPVERFKLMSTTQKVLVVGGIAGLLFLITRRKQVGQVATKAAEAAKRAGSSVVAAFTTVATVKKAMPNVSLAKLAVLLPDLTDALEEAKINTPKRVAAFLAQVGTESGDFKYFEELASGDKYEGRKDLGNTQKGDGRRYKGRGPIQLTGRANYRAFTKAIGTKYGVDFEKNPELLATPKWGFKAAAWFWNMRNLNQYADQGNIDAVSYRVNGGWNGRDERRKRYATATQALA